MDAAVRFAYADPPYYGCCGRYDHHHPDGLCWDDIDTHRRLLARLAAGYDGWVLHLSAPSLGPILGAAAELGVDGFRTMAWVKPWCAFKRNVSVAHAWEPVLVAPIRKPVVTGRMVMRDFISEGMAMRRGTTGAKPEAVCRWAFEVAGAEPDDELDDIYTGSGAVTEAWERWRRDLTLPYAVGEES